MQRYVSSELSHFVGRSFKTKEEKYGLLKNILDSGWLTHPPHTPNISGNLIVDSKAKLSENEMFNPQVVCFCDIPVADLEIHCRKYSRFGLTFDKDKLIGKGASPVHYIPESAQVEVPRRTPIQELWEELAGLL